MSAPEPSSIDFIRQTPQRARAGEFSREDALRVLTDEKLDVLSLVHAAYELRKEAFGRDVQIHIINNAANGYCPEDCSYCSQAKTSETDIEKYPVKEEDEILEEARQAYEAGAHRYCMVFAGRGPSDKRTEKLAGIVRKIKAKYNIEVCVSAGLLDESKAQVLAEAGVNRYNHNLNTSAERYAEICTTHTFEDRLTTVRSAKKSGLDVCSGMIVGMGESPDEVVEIAMTLGELQASSIPVNFLIPFDGAPIQGSAKLSPAYCLRVLCMFRFCNPTAELRMAAGRELHLRSMQSMALFVANSLFLQGYLNSKGDETRATLQMIQDAGFDVVSDHNLDELIATAKAHEDQTIHGLVPVSSLKTRKDLRPALEGTTSPSN